jgi:glycosyltransferase involved in cell wall biosynthesis
MSSPTVAAIIPCFNAAEFVGDAIQSALAQTYARLEIVVVDDGSTDGLTDALQPFRDRIKLVVQPHQGLSATRNRGIRETDAELIALLDADDRWHPDKIRRQVAVLAARPDCCLVYTARHLIDRTGASVQEGTTWYPVLPDPVQGECLMELVRGNRLMSSSVMFRRASLGTTWFDERLAACEDWDLWLRLAEHHQFAYLAEPLTDIRMHDKNMQLDVDRMRETSLQVLELLVRRRPRREAVAAAQAILVNAAHGEYDAGNLSRARQLFLACVPALGWNGLRRYVISVLPASIRQPARAVWRNLYAKGTGAPITFTTAADNLGRVRRGAVSRTSRLWPRSSGWQGSVLGGLLAIITGHADQLGLGSNPGFGLLQGLGVVIGVAVSFPGLYLQWKGKPSP